MSEVHTQMKQIGGRIDEAQTLRGWYVNSYAQIEYLLGCFIAASINMAEYAALGADLPHQISKRIDRVNQVLEVDGPLSSYRALLDHVLPRFERGHSTRNLLAHGFCEYVFVSNNEWAMRFTKWHRDPSKPGRNLRLQRDFRLADLQREARELGDLAKEVVHSLDGIERQFTSRHD